MGQTDASAHTRLTRERVRQIETKVRKQYFADEGRSLVEPFLKATRDILSNECIPTSPEAFSANLDKATGWKNTPPRCLVNFLLCFGEVTYDDNLRAVSSPSLVKGDLRQKLTKVFEVFCMGASLNHENINYPCFTQFIMRDARYAHWQPSFETYKYLALQLIKKHKLPLNKQRQLKTSIKSNDCVFNKTNDIPQQGIKRPNNSITSPHERQEPTCVGKIDTLFSDSCYVTFRRALEDDSIMHVDQLRQFSILAYLNKKNPRASITAQLANSG